jgi:hypothetical protein
MSASPINTAVFGCRTVRIGERIYVRVEDVAYLIREFGSSEETDVRNRANELAANLERLIVQ